MAAAAGLVAKDPALPMIKMELKQKVSMESLVKAWYSDTLATAPPPTELYLGVHLERNFQALFDLLEAAR